MLLQSHDVIRVFPAVPGEWDDVTFDKLLAEGAFEVSAVRRGGKTQFIRLKSLAGEPCRLKTDLKDPVRLTADGKVPVKVDQEGIITLELAKGEDAVLVAKAFSGDIMIEPVHQDPKSHHFYGLKE